MPVEDSEFRRELGRRLTLQRHRLCLTQSELARRSGVNVQSVRHYEHARRSPTAGAIRALAHALGVSADYLLVLRSRR